ncbi:sigma-54 dependent transcriptional regulator [Candidatus Albibeggiatoa sp. nov. NOAA]|uniref:sigma-54-dependent transcriptional regulator n=1 Tax=Candidatus Albibeggiatoa sp. nov. NOAA TaxID=3162724 RepID=UPI0032F226A5|nr:sigma-54 dependent transcriptional regulator [Thiotrichaceae bacterium]
MMKKFNCLVVDDEPELLETLIIDLQRSMGIACQSASTLYEAKILLSQKRYDLCITDMALNPPHGKEGLELVQHIQAEYPNIPTIIITAFGDMDNAIQAFRQGAFDYITKPLDFSVLHNVVKNALPDLNYSSPQPNKPPELIGISKPVQDLRKQIKKIARSEAAIHISGESGSGKELVARSIHHYSTRSNKAFIPVNCGAIPEDLVESELFGHKKGSFTGAHSDRTGLFEEAKGGTLFLDEVSELPLNMQVKLLRAIQEKAVRPVGMNKEIATDVRIISATHQNLLDLVNQGKFREDLYFRIRVFELQVPPLRDRTADIKLLVQHIMQRLRPNETYTITAKALTALEKYHYRGNVRELENIIEAAMTLCTNHTIKPSNLEFIGQAPCIDDSPLEHVRAKTSTPIISPTDDLTQSLTIKNDKEKFDCHKMLIALQQTGWNKTRAAKLLDMPWGKFRHRYDKYGLDSIKPF